MLGDVYLCWRHKNGKPGFQNENLYLTEDLWREGPELRLVWRQLCELGDSTVISILPIQE